VIKVSVGEAEVFDTGGVD